MTILQHEQAKLVKAKRLNEAQRLMAKAYRGIDYVDAHLGRPPVKRPLDLFSRGVGYSI